MICRWLKCDLLVLKVWCAWLAHVLFITHARLVHDLPLICIWPLYLKKGYDTHWCKYPSNYFITFVLLGSSGVSNEAWIFKKQFFLFQSLFFCKNWKIFKNVQNMSKTATSRMYFLKFIQLLLKNSGSNPTIPVPCSFLLHLTPCLTPSSWD